MALTIDPAPLRESSQFRLLWSSSLITRLGAMVTYVAAPYQVKELTDSYLAVGLLGIVEVVPLVMFALYGGAIADRYDRKAVSAWCEAAFLVCLALLTANALRAHPSLLAIYLVAMAMAALDGLQRPSLDAMLPRLVRREHLAAASAWQSLTSNAAVVIGTAFGGLIVVRFGTAQAFAIDAVTYALSLVLLLSMQSVPSAREHHAPAVSEIVAAARYAASRRDLLGTYLIDTVAMTLAYPAALFPFLADELHHPESLGLLYASGAIGAALASTFSGWSARVARHGWAIIVSATTWGLAIAAAGLAPNISLVLIALTIAGAADMYSGLFRSLMWNLTIPDELRGRMASIEMLSYSLGPRAGEVRASLAAQSSGMRASLISGGILCASGVLAVARALPALRKFRAITREVH